MKIHLTKVKNRYRCWGARLDSSILELLDVRDIKKEKIHFNHDEETKRVIIRLSSEMESSGSNLCSFTMDDEMKDGEYAMIDSYEDGDYIFYEFEFKN